MEVFRTVHDTTASTQIAAIITVHLFVVSNLGSLISFQKFLIGYAHIAIPQPPGELSRAWGI